jgi:hypothetical protein
MSADSTDPVVAARRELHELTVLASALLRLATKVQSRLDELRHTLGDTQALDDAEIDRHAPRRLEVTAESALAEAQSEEDDPAALLAMSLAGEGMSREQIGDYLRQSFGMQETDALLDRVLPDNP